MGRRYAFWLGPDGRPFKKEGGKHAPTNALAEIGRTASTSEPGKISWQGFDIHRLELAVKSGLCVIGPDSRELNEADTWGIGWHAIKTLILRSGGGNALSASEFLAEANREAARFFRQPEERYLLVTSLSAPSLPANSIKSRAATIRPLKSRGTRFAISEALRRQASGGIYEKHLRESKYLLVKIELKARSIPSAVQTGLEALSLALGLWNLALTHRSWKLSWGMANKPTLAAIHSGPIHTLHRADGSAIGDIWWYDPDYSGDVKILQSEEKWKKAENSRRWATRKLQTSPLRVELESLIISYAAAVEQTNLAVAFLSLWALLERITNTVGKKYDETIRRATWIYDDRGVVKELLEAARLRRNQFVHAAKSPEERDQLAQFLKGVVEDHLVRLLHNRLRVSSIEQYAEFLRLGPNVDSLRETRRRLARALAFLQT